MNRGTDSLVNLIGLDGLLAMAKNSGSVGFLMVVG